MVKTLSECKTPRERRSLLMKEIGITLTEVERNEFKLNEQVHCENIIGATTLPLGVAGPVRVNRASSQKNYYIPLATTEGALVASINRGCKAITLSGGTQTHVEQIGVTRGPVFKTIGISESIRLKKWIDEHFLPLSRVVQKTSHHIKLTKIGARCVGTYLFVRFYFDTDQAMGMNMVTIATDMAIQYIANHTQAQCISLSGNFCIDKKPAWLNFISGRGRRVWAEVVIPRNIVTTVLKSSPELLYNTWYAKCMLGSIMSGSLGFNSQYANVVAAFFAATGQDLAHVVEGSMGITTAEVLPGGDLYFSTYMPSVMIGIVGGGTKLTVKKEALSIMRVKSTDELSEVLAAAVLAGELSLLASLQEGSLAKTHLKLGR